MKRLCDEFGPITIPLGIILEGQVTVTLRQTYYRKRLVDFAIMVNVEHRDHSKTPVQRVDCCHGTIHRHRFNWRAVEVANTEIADLVSLANGGTYAIIEREYDRAYGYTVNSYMHIIDEWRGS